MTDTPPLAGIRVLDLSDGYGAYGARLLADLGAEVVRILPDDPEPPLWPEPAKDGTSVHQRFVDAGKVIVSRAGLDAERIAALVTAADVVIEAEGALQGLGFDTPVVAVLNPDLVRVTVSPFGAGANPDAAVDDLLVLGAGGLLHLGGYTDLGPMGVWGGQAAMASSIFAAVAALTGLIAGEGMTADVSAQECVAQALEDTVAEFSLTGRARDRRGVEAREAATGTYPCADGYVSMVAGRLGTARAWASLVAWLVEAGTPGADDLTAPHWSDFSYRRTAEAIAAFGEVFARFAADRTKESLYRDAQARGIALSPVNDIDAVMADRQLAGRGFFATVDDPVLGTAIFPGAPYRMSATPPLTPGPARMAVDADLDHFGGSGNG